LDDEIAAATSTVKLAKIDLTPVGLPMSLDAPVGTQIKDEYGEVTVYGGKGFCLKITAGPSAFQTARTEMVQQSQKGFLKDKVKLLANTDEMVFLDASVPSLSDAQFAQRKTVGRLDLSIQSVSAFIWSKKNISDIKPKSRAECLFMLKCARGISAKSEPSDPLEALRLYRVKIEKTENSPGVAVAVESESMASGTVLQLLAKIPDLRRVSLNGERIADDALGYVGQSKTLTWLSLWETHATDEGLTKVSQLPELEFLMIHSRDFKNGITARSIPELAKLPKLKQLHLGRLPLDDSSLAALEKYKSLEHLSVGDMPLTDACIEHLQKLKQLKRLEISGVKMTPAGFEKLKQALPNAKVTR
jgi:hypothetical protein